MRQKLSRIAIAAGLHIDDREADLNVACGEHATAHVGVRLASEPLQNRPYKQDHVPGSLRPQVAAAMVWLAGVRPGDRVLDPCCGAGTLLVEAAFRGGHTLGGDPDPTALLAAYGNTATARARVSLQRWDARALPVADGTVTCVLTNPPWGRKVAIEADAEAFYAAIGREVARVATPRCAYRGSHVGPGVGSRLGSTVVANSRSVSTDARLT